MATFLLCARGFRRAARAPRKRVHIPRLRASAYFIGSDPTDWSMLMCTGQECTLSSLTKSLTLVDTIEACLASFQSIVNIETVTVAYGLDPALQPAVLRVSGQPRRQLLCRPGRMLPRLAAPLAGRVRAPQSLTSDRSGTSGTQSGSRSNQLRNRRPQDRRSHRPHRLVSFLGSAVHFRGSGLDLFHSRLRKVRLFPLYARCARPHHRPPGRVASSTIPQEQTETR